LEFRPGKVSVTLVEKQNTNKKTVWKAQVLECLPNLQGALYIIPNIAKKRKEKEKNPTKNK
jgi:hypothetical protein